MRLDGVVAVLWVPLRRIHVEIRSEEVVLGCGSAVVIGEALALPAFFSS